MNIFKSLPALIFFQMTARQAERRLEDSRQEAAQLRNRLTIVEKSNADPNASEFLCLSCFFDFYQVDPTCLNICIWGEYTSLTLI